ncbi:MAG: class I SAM-dependent methyltransferase [Coriobacteriia bacterium]|nr:class I SAM-dependent methyltransferase [Coriobacteriia bacterium]
MVFGAYSRYYGLFYGDKPYAEEAGFVDALLHEYGSGIVDLLELGCGTGRHAREFASLGYRVHGIDLSETMLEDASSGPPGRSHSGALSFELADARTYRAGRTFDAVVSLFHVMSYQTTNGDLLASFRTAAEHLGSRGLFVFDCWYGPAVLTERPEHREKTLEDEAVRVTRLAEPVMRPNDDVCEVHYRITVAPKDGGEESVLEETHEMRYLFAPEVALALDSEGFDVVRSCEFGTGAELDFHTWNGCFVARKR